MFELRLRTQWGGDNVKFEPMPKKPVDIVVLHHTATKASANSDQDMRNIENGEQATGYSAIAYNEMTHPNGTPYEGRGFQHKGAATLNRNSDTLSYCFIGNFQTDIPTTLALETCAQRLAQGVREGKITRDFKLRPHSDFFATACPGTNLKPHIPTIRERVNQILDGATPAPNPQGVKVTEFKTYYATIGTDDQGNGYVDVYHDKGLDPTIAVAVLNGTNPKTEGYTKIGGAALATASYGGNKVIVSLLGGTPKSGTGIKVLMGW
jgi:N-acetylmuramoyl-L-alanine amidase-like protein